MNILCLLCIFQSKVKIRHTSFCDTRDTISDTALFLLVCVFGKDQSTRSNLALGQHSPLIKNRQRKRKEVRVKKKVRKVTGGNNRQRERGKNTE